jgi:hypothetical protein
VAKKSSTPAPPRKVQAPQRRSDPKKRPSWTSSDRLPLFIGLAVLIVAAVVVAVVFVGRGGGGNSTAAKVPDDSQLAGLQIGPAPWNPGLDTLPDRLKPVGVNALTNEGEVLHIHQHLDIYVNGKHEVVPQGIGIYDGQFLTELHTHDASGIMHVESPVAKNFDLGQFFGVWGVRLNTDCVGGYCREVTPWTMYVNGQAYQGDPAALVLKEHQEIVIVVGTPPKKIPSTYKFPAGL